MTGIIFIELINIVKANFGIDIYTAMKQKANDDGEFVKAGNYSHFRLFHLVDTLSELTRISTHDLLALIGQQLFLPLFTSLPIKIGSINNTIDFVIHVETYIHHEAQKVYPHATMPKFNFIFISTDKLIMDYHSPRCMGNICFGLLKGCAQYFNEKVDITMQLMNETGSHVRFTLNKS
ncbi:heme NO-binding domain-containing protein [Shewanella surugensis]|uniref:Heme NO-binding domain-containing protein n=1 Tax=Shewanella surugensis TaxID=212020 RepID=A0ABT0LE71_9GAMM|nr:heme NO-binding domain-containing protein [Shewanella surugensis]MCL1125993.1 heme NO-binding domain-containing protein [Shewanella surugensis]